MREGTHAHCPLLSCEWSTWSHPPHPSRLLRDHPHKPGVRKKTGTDPTHNRRRTHVLGLMPLRCLAPATIRANACSCPCRLPLLGRVGQVPQQGVNRTAKGLRVSSTSLRTRSSLLAESVGAAWLLVWSGSRSRWRYARRSGTLRPVVREPNRRGGGILLCLLV